MVPLELCFVPRGQVMRKQVPDDKVKDVLEFSTMRPEIRLEQIKKGIRVILVSDCERDLVLIVPSRISNTGSPTTCEILEWP